MSCLVCKVQNKTSLSLSQVLVLVVTVTVTVTVSLIIISLVETTLTVFLSAMLSNDTDICMVAGRDEPGPPLLVSHRRRTVQINPLRLQKHARTRW